jgi:hypothetical protein
MAMTYQEYIQKTGCQLVADQLISGFPHHKLLGSIRDGAFTLTEDGQEYLAQFEAVEAKPTRGRKKKEVGGEEVDEVADE